MGSFRLAAYAGCDEDGRVLLAHHASRNWTLPGGRVEHAEDPFDAVIREVAEETGCAGPRWSTSASPWRGPLRRPATPLPSRSAA